MADTTVGVPCETLYLNNLHEKVRVKDMRNTLNDLFSPFGTIQEIKVKKSLALRGQAFVIFDSMKAASAALNALQGHELYYKHLRIQYARFKSHCNLRHDDEELTRVRQEQRRVQAEKKLKPRLTKRQFYAQLLAQQSFLPDAAAPSTAIGGGGGGATTATSAKALTPMPSLTATGELSMPNKILFIQNIPSDYPAADLVAIVSKFPGFVELRSIPTKRDIAFAEFTNELLANTARLALDHFHLGPTQELHVSFAKK